MRKQKLISLVSIASAVLALTFLLTACGGGGGGGSLSRIELRASTGGEAGTYYACGTALADILKGSAAIDITVNTSGGSKSNIQLVNSSNADIAFAQSDICHDAYNGTATFNGERTENFYAIAALYTEVCQLVVRPGSGIASVEDLAGKRVSIADTGSAAEYNARQILAAYGLGVEDVTAQNLSVSASAAALRDGTLDAFFCTLAAPNATLTELADSGMEIISIDTEHYEALVAEYPYYVTYTIPAGTYTGIDTDIETVGVKSILIARRELEDEAVARLAKALLDNASAIGDAVPRTAGLTVENITEGITIPLHPGVAGVYGAEG